MKKISSKAIIISLIGAICIVPLGVWAINTVATGYKTTTTDRKVYAHGVCNEVRHTGWSAYFVPTKTSAEWSAVRNNSPSWLAISTCCTSIPAQTLEIKSDCAGGWRTPVACPPWYTDGWVSAAQKLDCRGTGQNWDDYQARIRYCTRAATTVCWTSQCTSYPAHSFTRDDECWSIHTYLTCPTWYVWSDITDWRCEKANGSSFTQYLRKCTKWVTQFCSYD